MFNINLRKIFIYLFIYFIWRLVYLLYLILVLTNENQQQMKKICMHTLNKIKHKC